MKITKIIVYQVKYTLQCAIISRQWTNYGLAFVEDHIIVIITKDGWEGAITLNL